MPYECEDEIDAIIEVQLYTRLVNYLHQLKFNQILLGYDGNSAPKAISCRVFENANEFQRVREEVCNFILEEHAKKLVKLKNQKTTKEVILGKDIADAIEEGDKIARRISVSKENLQKQALDKLK